MTYESFMAAEAGDAVRIEGYISARQSWWNNAAVIYLTGAKGEGYLVYNCPMTEEEFNTKYTIGTCVNILAEKTIYKGLHEIDGKTVSKINVVENADSYQAVPVDCSKNVSTDELQKVQNSFFTATLKVKEYTTSDQDTTVSANKAYGYQGELRDGKPTKDLYFTLVDTSGNELPCCIESYLTGASSDVYNYVLENLKVNDLVKVTGFMYWWNGANPHIVSIAPQVDTEYENFMSTAVGDEVTVTGKVYARQSWYKDEAVIYMTSTSTGEGYVVYKMKCTQEQFNTDLAVGSVIKVTGTKANYKGLEEITEASYVKVDTAIDVTKANIKDFSLSGAVMGSLFTSKLTVVEYTNPGNNETLAESKAYAYKGDAPTSDLYIKAKDAAGNVVSFCVPGYGLFEENGASKDNVYNTVKALAIGDKIEVTGSLYWWAGPNPHLFNITKVTE